MYADDIVLLFSGVDYDELETSMNIDLDKLNGKHQLDQIHDVKHSLTFYMNIEHSLQQCPS